MSALLPFSPAGAIGRNAKPAGAQTGRVGGIAIGGQGAAGTLYEGFVLSWGDEFEGELDVLAPHKPRGKWWTTRTYLAGSRGSDTLLGTMYDTDPFMTGHNDSNRGVPVGYDNMRQSTSVLTLQARKATTQEQAHMSSTRNEVAAMISGAGAAHWYPGDAGTGDIILEARIRFTDKATNPAGWHPTFWLQSLNPTIATNADEMDFEGSSQGVYWMKAVWTNGSATYSDGEHRFDHDGQWHTFTMVLNKSRAVGYVDGVELGRWEASANVKLKPQYPMITNHVYGGSWRSGLEVYSKASWDADPDGASVDVDWMRVWRRSSQQHIKPLVPLNDVNVDYGASTTITLPSAVDLWGDASVSEYLQVVYNEENEPGVMHGTTFTQFPPGVSYNSNTRELTVNITSGKTGRLNFVLSAWKTSGATGEPARFAVNVGPVIRISNSLTYEVGTVVNVDLYAACDCGVLTTNGTSRAKTISITGLSGSGLTYNDSTGLLTGTFANGTFALTLTVTNSVGQTATKAITLSTAAAPAYASWTGPGWFDASDASTITLSGSQVTAIANKRTGGTPLTGAGTAANRIYATGAQNGRNVIQITRDVTDRQTPPRFSAPASDILSTMFQGEDKPYTVICVYVPTDANTGFPWSASDTVDGANCQHIGPIRRSTGVNSVRRQLVNATPNDVDFGAGQGANIARVLAIKHTGTAVTVWDRSTTKAVDAAAQDVGAFNNELQFRLWSAETNNSTDPSFSATQMSGYFCEIVLESSARTDAEIVQAIQDLANKWGVTLV